MSVAEEERISLEQAAEQLGVSTRTVRSYAKNGHRGIKLEHIPLPKNWRTSREAVQRFLDAQTVKNDPSPEPIESHEEKRAKFHTETAHLRGKSNGRRSRRSKTATTK